MCYTCSECLKRAGNADNGDLIYLEEAYPSEHGPAMEWLPHSVVSSLTLEVLKQMNSIFGNASEELDTVNYKEPTSTFSPALPLLSLPFFLFSIFLTLYHPLYLLTPSLCSHIRDWKAPGQKVNQRGLAFTIPLAWGRVLRSHQCPTSSLLWQVKLPTSHCGSI